MDNELMHHGVKGMKWGVRRDAYRQRKAEKLIARNEKKKFKSAKRVHKARRSGDLSKLTLQEMMDLNQRLHMEKNMLEMMPDARRKHLKKINRRINPVLPPRQSNPQNPQQQKQNNPQNQQNRPRRQGLASQLVSETRNQIVRNTSKTIARDFDKYYTQPVSDTILGIGSGPTNKLLKRGRRRVMRNLKKNPRYKKMVKKRTQNNP